MEFISIGANIIDRDCLSWLRSNNFWIQNPRLAESLSTTVARCHNHRLARPDTGKRIQNVAYDRSRNEKSFDKPRYRNSGSRNNAHGFGPPPTCLMPKCTKTHYLGQCSEFAKLNFAGKLEVVREHRLCRCCLMTGHMAITCKRSGCNKCPEAKIRHHFRLCAKSAEVKATDGIAGASARAQLAQTKGGR